jgi:hypothetical protein
MHQTGSLQHDQDAIRVTQVALPPHGPASAAAGSVSSVNGSDIDR